MGGLSNRRFAFGETRPSWPKFYKCEEIEKKREQRKKNRKSVSPNLGSDGPDGRLKGPHMDGRPTLYLESAMTSNSS